MVNRCFFSILQFTLSFLPFSYHKLKCHTVTNSVPTGTVCILFIILRCTESIYTYIYIYIYIYMIVSWCILSLKTGTLYNLCIVVLLCFMLKDWDYMYSMVVNSLYIVCKEWHRLYSVHCSLLCIVWTDWHYIYSIVVSLLCIMCNGCHYIYSAFTHNVQQSYY